MSNANRTKHREKNLVPLPHKVFFCRRANNDGHSQLRKYCSRKNIRSPIKNRKKASPNNWLKNLLTGLATLIGKLIVLACTIIVAIFLSRNDYQINTVIQLNAAAHSELLKLTGSKHASPQSWPPRFNSFYLPFIRQGRTHESILTIFEMDIFQKRAATI